MTTSPVTMTKWLKALVDSHAAAPALVEPGGLTVSYAELEKRAARLAGGLGALGVRRGDRLASFVPNGVLPVELLMATARLGAVFIGVNTRYRSEDLRHLLRRARPAVLVGAAAFLGIDFAAIVGEALAGLEGVPPRVMWPVDLESLRGAEPVGDDRATPDDLLVAFTTSGTTGQPKLAAHDHATTIRHLNAAGRSLEAQPGCTGLLELPFCGTFGFVSLLAVLSGGGRVIVPPRFEPADAAALIESYRVTHFNASDDMILAVAAAGRDVSSWRQGVHAEFTGRGLEAVRVAERFGARITGVYGSSETFALLARRSSADPVAGRARNGGIPVDPATGVRVVDGELQLRGPSVLSAYLDGDGVTSPSLLEGGWFATGDLAVAEADGGFAYIARRGDALRLAGFLTDPAEIEQHLLSHPAVSGAQVVGASHPGTGSEVAIAFVTTVAPVSEAVLVSHCWQHLANYKVPARIIALESFPTVDGANGVKIRKAELRQAASQVSF